LQGGEAVQRAIEVLMGEHRLIEQALGSLETYAEAVAEGFSPGREVIGEYAAFLRGFADTCHHGKEEEILFRRMIERGFSRDSGPIAVMLHEHDLGRAHVRALQALAAGTGTLSPRETDELLRHVSDYVPLLRVHIQKEDHVLYPIALRILTGPELDSIESQFETFEASLRADGTLDRLAALADRLTARFRPDPARTTPAEAFPACLR
jgi:hemerythrin-like domain-containing protein